MVEAGRIKEKDGKDIVLDKVLLYAKGADIRIGQPYLKDVKVTAKIIDHYLGDKVQAFQYRIRKNSARKVGYRSKLTSLNITKISA